MTTLQINNAVTDAIGGQYPDKGLFDKHFNIALNKVPESTPKEAVIAIVIASMQSMLSDYAKSTPTTKGGKVGRFFARLNPILSILKFIKIK